MSIELYYSPYCDVCADSRLRAAAEQHGVTVKDITACFAEAVGLRIVQPPALVLDGKVIAQGAAAVQELTELVEARSKWTHTR